MPATELAVVGAGPAGLAAAVAAARAGVRVTLLDEQSRPGGQYLKGQSPPRFPAERQGQKLLEVLPGLPVTLRTGVLVWGIEGNRLALRSNNGVETLEAGAIVAAAGARERVLPFPGWTLPGVMTLGAAQILAKAHGVVPGGRVLLAGSGPLLPAAAAELARHGANVVAVLEATHPGQWPAYASAVWGNWGRLQEGWYYLRRLWQARIPYRFGRTVIRATGSPAVETVVVAQVNRRGYPVAGTEQTFAVNALCLGFGFVPNIELTQLAGCKHRFDEARGGWTPVVDEALQTSIPGLFAAGETTGIAGAAAALLEGELAGLSAAHYLGRLSHSQLAHRLNRLAGPRQRLRRFGAMLNTLFAPRPGLYALPGADTPLCRCREVPASAVRAAINQGAGELDALKIWTPVGQGACQGRTCGPLLARFIAAETGHPQEAAGCFSVRPPLKPILLGELAAGQVPALPNLPETAPAPRPTQAAPAGKTTTADVVVIGGGIVGAACAYYLSAAGLDVHVVEQKFPAGGTSRACDSLILLWDKTPGPELTLGQASAALWAGLAGLPEMDFEYARCGTLLLVEDEQGMAAGRARAETMAAAGVRVEPVDAAGLRVLEPNLAPDLPGGVFFPDDAQVDARRATLALLLAACRQGATFHPAAKVTAIRQKPGKSGGIRGVVTGAGEIATETVVCAAGVWSNAVARLVGVNLPVRPRQGHILVTAAAPGIIRHPLLEGGYVATVQSDSEALQAALVAELTAGGTLLLGSSRRFAGFNRTVQPAIIQAIARRGVRFLPALAGVRIIRSYAGLRPWSPDHLPLVGPVEAVPGFYLATGHEGAGICLAPVTGQLIAGWLTGPSDLPPVAAAVRPGRFETL